MKTTIRFLLSALLITATFNNCLADEPTLKNRYEPMFKIGTAASAFQLHGTTADLVKSQFNSLTPENCMKPDALYRGDGNCDFRQADALVDFAQANGLAVRGHTLVWHSQTPKTFFLDDQNNRLDKTVLYARLEQYMTAVLTHFRGKVYCWDVVNEALADGGPGIYRVHSPWYEICGPEFIAEAFRMARRIDPEIKLFYNDYNLIDPAKRGRAVAMLKELKATGVPIDGVGLQGHWNAGSFNPQELQNSLDAFAELGLEIQITELDISVYTPYHGPDNEKRNQSMAQKPYTEDVANQLADAYEKAFAVLRRNADKISGVTFWGISDRFTWLNYFPHRGRKDYPLLFDDNGQPKKAFHRVVDF